MGEIEVWILRPGLNRDKARFKVRFDLGSKTGTRLNLDTCFIHS